MSRNKIFASWHDKSEMAMAATTLCGGDSTCIGIDFFGEQLNSCVGGCFMDFGEHWMWECESKGWHGHGGRNVAVTQRQSSRCCNIA